MKVFVLDTNKKTQNPVNPAKARLLLSEGKAAVFRQYPFTIILKEDVVEANPKPLRKTVGKTIQGIGWKYCRVLHLSDGYSYNTTC